MRGIGIGFVEEVAFHGAHFGGVEGEGLGAGVVVGHHFGGDIDAEGEGYVRVEDLEPKLTVVPTHTPSTTLSSTHNRTQKQDDVL